jgi:hypothetical protein
MDYAPSPAEDPSASDIGPMNRPSPRSAFEARPSRTQIAPTNPDAIYSESRRDVANPDAIYSESRHDVANPDAIYTESRRDAGVTTLVAKPPSRAKSLRVVPKASESCQKPPSRAKVGRPRYRLQHRMVYPPARPKLADRCVKPGTRRRADGRRRGSMLSTRCDFRTRVSLAAGRPEFSNRESAGLDGRLRFELTRFDSRSGLPITGH